MNLATFIIEGLIVAIHSRITPVAVLGVFYLVVIVIEGGFK